MDPLGLSTRPTEILGRLPGAWEPSGGKWLTLQIKDEDAIATVEKELAVFRESEKKHAAEVLGQARTLTTTITIIAFAVGIGLIGLALFIFIRRGLSLPLH